MKKIGFLRPHNGRYEWCEVLSVKGDKIDLVKRHPKRKQWDNYFTESKERVLKFAQTPSEDYANKMCIKISEL